MRTLKHIIGLGLLAVGLGACGAAGGPDGGGRNLPNRGIGPWETPIEELLLRPDTGRYARPSGVRDGDGVLLAFHREAAGELDLLLTRGASDGTTFTPPEVLLAGASQPSLTRDQEGRLWLAWVDAETDAIMVGPLDPAADGVAAAHATGHTGVSPAIAFDDAGTLHLLFIDEDAVHAASGPAEGPLGASRLVLAGGEGCTDDAGEPEDCWDATAIVDIDVRLAKTALGRRVWRMFYTGRRGTAHRFGFAASFDGHRWERYAYNPVLNAGNSGRAPTVIQAEDRYLLFHEDRTARGIVGRVLAPSAVSETW